MVRHELLLLTTLPFLLWLVVFLPLGVWVLSKGRDAFKKADTNWNNFLHRSEGSNVRDFLLASEKNINRSVRLSMLGYTILIDTLILAFAASTHFYFSVC